MMTFIEFFGIDIHPNMYQARNFVYFTLSSCRFYAIALQYASETQLTLTENNSTRTFGRIGCNGQIQCAKYSI